jgi:hypothetical protein
LHAHVAFGMAADNVAARREVLEVCPIHR